MGFIWLGIILIVLGILLGFTPLGGALAGIGWLLLIVGVVLALFSFIVPRGRSY